MAGKVETVQVTNFHMQVKFNEQCEDVLRRLEMDRAIVIDTCNNRTRGMVVQGNPMQLYATTWHNDGRIIYVNGLITNSEKIDNRLHIQEVTLSLALQLQEQLPARDINRNLNMEEILNVVANSFGLMISLDPNKPPSRLYNGSWQGQDFSPNIRILESIGNDFYYVTGIFNNNRTCHHIWMFSYLKYSNWFVGG